MDIEDLYLALPETVRLAPFCLYKNFKNDMLSTAQQQQELLSRSEVGKRPAGLGRDDRRKLGATVSLFVIATTASGDIDIKM
jgi:hypothetical protein